MVEFVFQDFFFLFFPHSKSLKRRKLELLTNFKIENLEWESK